MTSTKQRWTADEVLALNEACDLRLEVVDGELLLSESAPPSWEGALRTAVEELRQMGHRYLLT